MTVVVEKTEGPLQYLSFLSIKTDLVATMSWLPVSKFEDLCQQLQVILGRKKASLHEF